MTIAELFLNIGLKGAAGVRSGLDSVQKGMGEVVNSSLAAKAAVVGVVYGLERLTGFASQVGMDLNKFAIVTGLSTDELQRWQYVARTYDVTAEEMSGTVRHLQQVTTDMMLGKGMPDGAAALGIKMTRDPFNLLQQLAKAAKTLPPDIASTMIKSFGISDNVFQMLRASNLELDKLSQKDIISTKEIQQLTHVNKAWKDFWFQLRTMGIKLVAKEGVGAVRELSNAFSMLIEGVQYISKLTDKFKELKVIIIAIGLAIGLAFAPISTIVTAILALLSDIKKFREGKDSFIGDAKKQLDNSIFNPQGAMTGLSKAKDFATGLWEKAKGGAASLGSILPDFLVPGAPSVADKSKPAEMGTPKVEVHNYGVKNAQETTEATKRGITDAYRQLQAQVGGT